MVTITPLDSIENGDERMLSLTVRPIELEEIELDVYGTGPEDITSPSKNFLPLEAPTDTNPKRRYIYPLFDLIVRKRVDKVKRETGNNKYGRAGNLRCDPCRRRRRKVGSHFTYHY